MKRRASAISVWWPVSSTTLPKGRHPNLFIDERGMLSTDGSVTPVSWMNAALDGKPVVARSGYLVEFNALMV